MSKAPILSPIANISTGGPIINTNNDRVIEAFQNTLSRDGSTPNQMEADLDMNSRDILNAGLISSEDLQIGGDSINNLVELAQQARDEVVTLANSLTEIETSPLVESFTGDGVEDTFTLSVQPFNENRTQVYVDGVYQNKDTYLVDGFDILFSEAPPNLSLIEIIVLERFTTGVVDSSTVMYRGGNISDYLNNFSEPFESYSEALSAVTAELVLSFTVSAKVGDVFVGWVRQVDGTCLGGGWAPAGNAAPEHWGAGTTNDDAPALLAWFDWTRVTGRRGYALASSYTLLTPIVVVGFDVDFCGAEVNIRTGVYSGLDHDSMTGQQNVDARENPGIRIQQDYTLFNVNFTGDPNGTWESGLWEDFGPYVGRWHNVTFRDFGARAARIQHDDFMCTGLLKVENCQHYVNLRPNPVFPINYLQGIISVNNRRFYAQTIQCEVGYQRAISIGFNDRHYAVIGAVLCNKWDGTISGAQVLYANLTRNIQVGKVFIKDYSCPDESPNGGAACYFSRDTTNIQCPDMHVVVTGGSPTTRALVSRGNNNAYFHGYFKAPSQAVAIQGHRNGYDAADITLSGVVESDLLSPTTPPISIRGDDGNLTRVNLFELEFRANRGTLDNSIYNAFCYIDSINNGVTGRVNFRNVKLFSTASITDLSIIGSRSATEVNIDGIAFEKLGAGATRYCMVFSNTGTIIVRNFVLATSAGQTVIWLPSGEPGPSLCRMTRGSIARGRISLGGIPTVSSVTFTETLGGGETLNPNTSNNYVAP